MTSKKPHSLSDHLFGLNAYHLHEEGDEHDHAHDDSDHDVLDHGSRALESVPFISMGLDIGSSGTQIALSRLLMRGPGEAPALQRQVKSRETLYLSPVAFTPFLPDGCIDVAALQDLLVDAYEQSGVTPDEIETGAVIMTGQAALRANAKAIVDQLAQESGDIICAAAGHHMEAMLAAQGSGALRLSLAHHTRVLNIDIGGGTTKLALCEDGRVIALAALAIGGRLIVRDESGVITRLEPEGRAQALQLGLDLTLGQQISQQDMQRIADHRAEQLALVLGLDGTAQEDAGLFLTDPISLVGAFDEVLFSGGVAEFFYGREARDFGDLGRPLAQALRIIFEVQGTPFTILPAQECMRATVLGASEYCVQLSGQTSTITSHAALLPRRNLPVLYPPYDFLKPIDPNALGRAITQNRRAFDAMEGAGEMAFAFRWRGEPLHERLLAFAQGVALGLEDLIRARQNLYIMLEGDAALSLGAILLQEIGIESELLVLDGLVLRDFDYVDIGRMRMPSQMVPVTIKTLVFEAAQKKI